VAKGQLKDLVEQRIRGIMDYSSSLHEAENPAGVSPWGASPAPSPQHSRPSPYPASTEVPSSPTPYSTQTSSESYTEDAMGAESHNGSQSIAGTDSLHEGDSRRPDTAEASLGPPQEHQKLTGEPQLQQQRQEPSRYHHPGRQGQDSHGPQYKLQAKITGLERTGRKDPILRFDVHVRT
jgi:hypothetical protein